MLTMTLSVTRMRHSSVARFGTGFMTGRGHAPEIPAGGTVVPERHRSCRRGNGVRADDAVRWADQGPGGRDAREAEPPGEDRSTDAGWRSRDRPQQRPDRRDRSQGRGWLGALAHRLQAVQRPAEDRRRAESVEDPASLRPRRDPRLLHDLPGSPRHGLVLGSDGARARADRGRPRGSRCRNPLDVRSDGRHRS